MKIAPDILFPGARLKLGNDDYTCIKVNAKSFYATTMSFSEYKDMWDKRLKGTTFTKFCEAFDIKQYKYSDPFEIELSETGRKIIAETNTKSEYKISRQDKTELIEYINHWKKKKGTLKFTPQTALSTIKKVYFLEEKDDCYLADMEGDYIMFSLETDEWIKISTVYDFLEKYDHVPWELLSCFEEEKEIAVA